MDYGLGFWITAQDLRPRIKGSLGLRVEGRL